MECKCDMRTKLIGDGCEVCNPEHALWYAKQEIKDQGEAIKELVDALENALELLDDYSGTNESEMKVLIAERILNKHREK